jgi:hypothetical protein
MAQEISAQRGHGPCLMHGTAEDGEGQPAWRFIGNAERDLCLEGVVEAYTFSAENMQCRTSASLHAKALDDAHVQHGVARPGIQVGQEWPYRLTVPSSDQDLHERTTLSDRE